MRNGAMLKFPGWFNATGVDGTDAFLNITDSVITGFASAEIVSLGLDTDANNDAPVIRWAFTTASVFGSRIEKLYEHSSGAADLQLLSGTSLYAYDTYLAVDHSNMASLHNELITDASSDAYLYNVTIDTTQSPLAKVDWTPAYRPAAGGNVYLLRWVDVTVLDARGARVSGAMIWSRLSPSAGTAQYPANGMSTTPASRTLWYLGRTASGASQWNRTDGSGTAKIPLYTDRIDSTTLPNAVSFGNYDETATLGASTVIGGISYPAYPELAWQDNNRELTLTLADVVACSSPVTSWSFSRVIRGPVSVGGSLEVSGDVTIQDGTLYVDQQPDACAYVRVVSGGSLTFDNTIVWSNFALVVDVEDGGALTVVGSTLALTQRGIPGLLRSTGPSSSVSLSDSTIDGSVNLADGSASLVRNTFGGPRITLNTAPVTRLWDATFSGVTIIAFLTDDGNANTVDLDIRNTTFNKTLTSQLVFRGQQNVQLTSVQTYDPAGTWWVDMIQEGAKVSRYWWLSIRAVDGTETLLADANVTLGLQRLDPSTLTSFTVPNPAADDIYYARTMVWDVEAPEGYVIYRAFSESRTSSAGGRVVNNSYIADGQAILDMTVYPADAPAQAQVVADTVLNLNFSSLTPDLRVVEIQVSGGNLLSNSQPINTDITLTAVVSNSGQINVPNVLVSFFEDNVDKNNDGILDFTANDFRASVGIGDAIIPLVPKNGTATASVVWRPSGTVESSRTVSAVVDPPLVTVSDPGAVREQSELNNILASPVTLFTWPDLSVGTADIQFLSDPVVNNSVPLRVTIHNDGTNRATQATLQVFEGGSPVSSPATFDLANGATTVKTVNWQPTTTGPHTIDVRVSAKADTIRNTDYNGGNDQTSVTKTVLTQPNLELRQSDYTETVTVTQGQGFSVVVRVYNLGQTPAQNISVAVYLDDTRSVVLGRVDGLAVANFTDVTLDLAGIGVAGLRQVMAVADPDNRLNEGGLAQENDNFANITVDVQPPQGSVVINNPANGTTIEPGVQFVVSGLVRDRNFNGIVGVTLNVSIRNAQGNPVASTEVISQAGGVFTAVFDVTDAYGDGTYTVLVSAPGGFIASSSATFSVARQVPFLEQLVPILRIPWWLFLAIIAAVTGIALGATLYFKFYGLGRMVECGECGAFIPEDSTSCPKCGVEFEKDMAKCSNCQAWIPVDVKRCPECSVEFATGEVEMADYQEKMRLQYDEVVRKFKDEAQKQLGRSLSDREFQEWWRKQPTFVTFEDWLREEEEMRKMGSKPCPVCGTLNSVTATVCHKCGSLMQQPGRPPSGGTGGGTVGGPPAVKRPTTPAPSRPVEEPRGGSQAAPAGTEAIPRRIIRKPATGTPVVQKKIVKRPLGDSSQSTESSEGQSGSDAPDDEL